MKKERKLRLNKNFHPCEVNENEELCPNGIFVFNISRIIEHIDSGQLNAETEEINVTEWYGKSFTKKIINEDHLKTVVLKTPVIQAEISPGRYNMIDGRHRLEKAYRDQVKTLKSYKLKAEQLIPYFIDTQGYQAFVGYWNDKLTDL